MTVIKLIKELLKFYFKHGNLGLLRWKQNEGYVFIIKDFTVIPGNILQVRQFRYEPIYSFNRHVKVKVLDYIVYLFKMLIKHGNYTVEMFWNETGDNSRKGWIPVNEIEMITYLGKNYCELI